ncbi:aspartic peptidase domain-containing protein [Amylocystis lapponica]|nr:aspartic peptidase domain-containing protein [Amylocystis lapponica]
MRLYVLSFLLALSGSVSDAVKIPITRTRAKNTFPDTDLRRRSGDVSVSRPVVAAATSGSGELGMSTVHDLLYMANVIYPVQLDTGSSDLWVHGPSSPVPNSKPTSDTCVIQYGIGWASGAVSYAEVGFAGMTVPSQAFLDASQSYNPALSYGAEGLLGLGFNSLSTVDALVTQNGSATGGTFLSNAFAQDKSQPNFIAFSLQSVLDSGDDIPGVFSIGEYEPQYAAVQNSTAISTFPVSSPTRWSILLDALLVGPTAVKVSSTVANAPTDKAVVMLDSGTSYTYAPTEVVDHIYGSIAGASYSAALGQWIVPCSSEVDIALQFGNDVYPINPLDVTPTSLSNASVCTGSFYNESMSVGGGEFDWLIGDNVLRSLYTVYDFGDYDSSGNVGNPYIRLLSLVNPDQASAAFHQARGGTPNTNITYNAVNDGSSSGSSAAGTTSVSITDKLANSLTKVGDYLPAVLALMAFNSLVLLLLVAAGIVYMCRQRTKRSRTRKMRGRTSPLPMNPTSSFHSQTSPEAHVYEPVSMALTDDTFVPPSPAFSKPGFEGGTLRAGDVGMGVRPKSVA